MKNIYVLMIFVVCISACGPSPEELQATATQAAAAEFATQTAIAPTATATCTPTLTPTMTPTLTSTPTLTPTPTPMPNPDAMLNWKKLELSDGFIAEDPSKRGIFPGENAFQFKKGDRTFTKNIKNSFYFVNKDRDEHLFGYTVELTTTLDQHDYDSFLKLGPDLLRAGLSNKKNLGVAELELIDPLGENASGASASYSENGFLRHQDTIYFRIDGVGAMVTQNYREDTAPAISITDLGRVYAESIQSGYQGCKLVSIKYVGTSPMLIYEYQAEGFYPNEGRMLIIEGDFQIGGETKTFATMALGATKDAPRTDYQGNISETWNAGTISGKDVIISGDHKFTIFGLYSGCMITQTVSIPSQ